MNNRLGRFRISAQLLREQPKCALAALDGCLVVRAEHVWASDAIEYTAMHEGFDALDPGTVTPWYEGEITRRTGGNLIRRWVRISRPEATYGDDLHAA